MVSPPGDVGSPPRSSAPSFGSARISLGRMFRAESTNYFLLLGVTVFLVAFGLIMVLSSSFTDAHVEGQGFFSSFLKQGAFVLIGLPLMLVVSRLPQRFWRVWAWPMLAITCLLQVLVVATPLGYGVNNNTNWFKLGPIEFQPSEMIKIALVVWLGVFYARKRDRVRQWRFALLPALVVTGGATVLVLLGNDLGTVMIMAGIVVGALFFAGTPIRQLVFTALLVAAVGFGFAITSENRMDRILAFLHPHTTDYLSTGWQIQQGMFALAHGGIFGVGLGNSNSKWSWLPASSTDFIFAITGEELGLIGAVLLIGLFVVLAVILCRIITGSDDPFERVVTGAVLVWILGQALVNIAVVLGVVPTLGVPLPLISRGGTSLLSTLFALGIVLSFTRSRPSARPVTAGRGGAR